MKENIVLSETFWPHAPVHCFPKPGTYFVTTLTCHSQHFFRAAVRLALLQRGLLKLADIFGWRIKA